MESVANIGPHYARTLREWRHRFIQRFEDVIVPALQKEYAARSAAEKDGRPQGAREGRGRGVQEEVAL